MGVLQSTPIPPMAKSRRNANAEEAQGFGLNARLAAIGELAVHGHGRHAPDAILGCPCLSLPVCAHVEHAQLATRAE